MKVWIWRETTEYAVMGEGVCIYPVPAAICLAKQGPAFDLLGPDPANVLMVARTEMLPVTLPIPLAVVGAVLSNLAGWKNSIKKH